MDDTASAAAPAPRNHLLRYLADARQRLIQTGTRNRLIHSARFAKRGKSIDIVDERSDDIFRIIVTAGRRMRFDHDPHADNVAEEGEPLLVTGPAREKGEERFTDSLLQTRFGQDKLQKKLLGLAREAKTLEEEQGVNALYLALGFLRWFEDERSEMQREAPLVLLPVSLNRNDRTSIYDLGFRGEDIVTNEPLKRRLSDDFGIKLPEIDEGDEWQPSDYFAAVSEAVSGQSRWSIDPHGMQLGFFSFAKLLMFRDLEPENWPGDGILDHPVLAGLLADGFDDEAADFTDVEKLDEIFTPASLIQVVDADASQTLVIETVRKGRNLVVKGPPGTGKSQTITNIIASAVHDGKSVLFMAEKMAALNVVHKKLVDEGLRDICLELHSRSANKKLVAQELGRTLNATATFSYEGSGTEELTRLRDQLNGLSDAMHLPIGDTDITPYRAVSTLVRLREEGFAPVDYPIAGVNNWSRPQLNEALDAARGLAEITAKAGTISAHPFLGADRNDLLPTDRERLKARLTTALAAVEGIEKTANAVAQNLGVSDPPNAEIAAGLATVLNHISALPSGAGSFAAALADHGGIDEARRLAEAGLAIAKIIGRAEVMFKPAAVTAVVTHLRPMLAAGSGFFGRLGGNYRAGSAELESLISGPLPKRQRERMKILDQLTEWQHSIKQFQDFDSIGANIFGELWRGTSTDFDAMAQATQWTGNLLQLAPNVNPTQAVQLRRYKTEDLRGLCSKVENNTAEVMEDATEIFETLSLDLPSAFGATKLDTISFAALAQKIRLWLEHIDRLDEWSQLHAANQQLQDIAGNALANAVAGGEIAPNKIASTIRHIHAESMYRQFAADKPWAIQMTSEKKAELIGSFREREKRRRGTTSRLIRGIHANAMPRGGMGAMGFIRGEIGRKRGHRPIRKVVSEAGSSVQQIKPVFLMSPISVAQYLPPGIVEFDLLVIDEASQVRPEDAFGAIARARQIVVVGDRQQLPPTSFFDRVVSDTEDEEVENDADEAPMPTVTAATELESVLTLCEARGLKTRMLNWHYRSRHPSLIEVSNEHFYEGKLTLFPSPSTGKDADGLIIQRVNGAYDRGGKRNNPIEAEAVARAVAIHATRFPARTLGVVTFSTAQRDQVTFWLDKLRQDDEALDEFMREGKAEEFFVKNIENVQGDERDVIYISVGYGPRIAGHRLDSMAFGPVSSDGGERRLNVLFTRSRYRTEVFVSFASADIDLSRTKSVGARVLKHFLHSAETGISVEPKVLDADPDSDFEVSVANAIRTMGYEVDYQIGSAGFKIDLAVRDPNQPGRYILAVECDGATYHSALWARERDRQRQEVLEGLGWRFHRVWSTDWFHRRTEELRRIEDAIHAASQAETIVPEPDIVEEPFMPAEPIEDEQRPPERPDLPDYVIADFPIFAAEEPHEVSIAKMNEIVERIVQIEGPVHREEIARRVAALFGKQKAGSRIASRVDDGLRYLRQNNSDIRAAADFWFTSDQERAPPLRNRSRAPLNLRKAALLPPLEIEAAIKAVLAENGALIREDIPRAVALHFGFQRTGPEFRPAIEPVIETLLVGGAIADSGAGMVLSNGASDT